MKKKQLHRLFSAIMAFAMVFTLALPMNVSANDSVNPFKQNGTDESTMLAKAAVAQQLNLLEGESALHKDLQGLSESEEVAVIVHLSEKPVALEKGIKELAGKKFTSSDANAVKSKVKAQHSFFKKEMNANNISFTEGFSYDTVLNGFSMTVKAADLEKILDINGVTLIEPDVTVHALEDTTLAKVEKGGQVGPAMDTSIGFLGIEALWAEGYEGQGIKVAVLDTGIDADHPDLKAIYKGGKNFVPHNGNDYARQRADDDASETSPLDRPSHRAEFDADGRAFYTSHGTHVAGTIAAIGNNEYGIKGIAPKVDLYAYRVLGAYGSGSTSGIIKAIDTAVIEGMDVINLSLGVGSNTETDSGSFAINNAMLAGTISVIATGNSGPNRGTMGTPATARLGIAVGNTTNPEAHYFGDININAGDYNLTKQLNLMGTTYGTDLAAQLDGEYSLVAVPGLGKPTDYAGLDVDGKVVLVSRGEIAFVDKIAAAKDKGAIAIIVHNFAGGTNAPDASGTFLGDDFEFIPTFDMSQTDGDAIRAALAQAEGTISFGNFDKTMTVGDEVNSSSSRGPSTPNFDIKPDVAAPGTNIMSTIPMYKADFPEATYDHAFTRKTGTSMATPHIAGIAALVKQANPDWNAFDVKVALSNTAKVLDTGKYDVFAQGAGRVNAYAAAHPEILAYAIDTANNDGETVDNLKGTVTFGPQDLADGDITVQKQILIKDIGGNGGDYTVEIDYTKAFGDAKITVDQPQFTLNGEMLLTVTLTASETDTKAGDELLGYIRISKGGTLVEKTSLTVNKTTLTLNTGGKEQLTVKENITEEVGERVEVSLPFAADFGGVAPTEVKDMRITETDLSFNGDGVKDSAMLYFTITGDVATNYIELWDIMNPDGGAYGDGYIGYLHAGSSLGAGSYQLGVTGQYRPWGGTGPANIPDGLYTIDFTALSASGVIGDFVGPVVVKSTAGTIEGQVEGATVTGQVDDAYIAYQEELVWYELGYDINTKLKASYEVLNGEEVVSSGPISLEQDGAFTFELPELNKQENSVKVKYEDAAGNKAEKVIYTPVAPTEDVIETIELGTTEEPVEKETPENPSFPEDPEKQIEPVKAESVSNLVQIASFDNSKSVQSNEKIIDGPAKTDALEGKDVTNDATYKVADESIVTVEKGLVTAKKAGTTKITVTYGDNEPVVVTVTVKDPVVVNPTPNPTPQPPVVKEEKPEEEKPTLPVFTDIANTFAAKEINALVAKGIIQGKSETKFAPNAQITRAEFAVLLARALELPLEEYEGIFGDVDTSKKWAFAGVEAAAHAGIVNGTSDGKFNPDAPIKREEIAAMIIRAIEFKNKEKLADLDTPANFDDHGSIGTFAIDSVYKAAALGVIKGNEGNFLPKNNATRAEAAVMLYRALDVLELLD